MHRVPPHNIDAEHSILASMLLDRDSITEITARPEYFYKPSHQEIFRAAMELHNKKEHVDIITVGEKLTGGGKLQEVGGMAYLAALADFPVSVNPEYHCGILKKHYDLRRLIEISSEIISQSFDQSTSPVEIIGKAQREIIDIGKDISNISTMTGIMNKVIDKISELRQFPGRLSGIPTGFRDLNFHTSGLQDCDLILIGGRPSMGKTALALNLCKNIAVGGYPVLVFSLEMSGHQFGQRLIADEAKLNLRKIISGRTSNEEFNAAYAAASILGDLQIFIEDDTSVTVEDMISIARKIQMRHGIRIVVVDYLQLIKGWNKDGQGPKADISRALKLMAKSMGIPVVALSQLNRSCELRANKRPIIADLREAGALEQDADIIMFLYRDEVYNTEENNPNIGKAELIIRKNRQGTTGTVFLSWNGEQQRFANLENVF